MSSNIPKCYFRENPMARFTGWRYGAFIGSFLGLLGICVYTAMIRPMINSEDYKKVRERARSQLPPDKVI